MQQPDPVAMMKMMLVDPPHANGNLALVLDAVGQFLGAPRQTLALKIEPTTPFRLEDVLTFRASQSPGALADLFERFHVLAEVKPQ